MKTISAFMSTIALLLATQLVGAQVGEEPEDRWMQIETITRQITTERGITEERKEGWLEYTNERYTVELRRGGIQAVRLFRLTNSGSYNSITARLENVRERLEYAFDQLLRGKNPQLEIRKHRIDQSSEERFGVYCSVSPTFDDGNPSGRYPIRIISVSQKDANQFPALDRFEKDKRIPVPKTPERLATYLAAQIEAHLQLFIKRIQTYDPYEQLAMNQSNAGKIYREIFLRAREVAKIESENDEITSALVDDALDRVSQLQRKRLQRRYYLIPRDWQSSIRGSIFK